MVGSVDVACTCMAQDSEPTLEQVIKATEVRAPLQTRVACRSFVLLVPLTAGAKALTCIHCSLALDPDLHSSKACDFRLPRCWRRSLPLPSPPADAARSRASSKRASGSASSSSCWWARSSRRCSALFAAERDTRAVRPGHGPRNDRAPIPPHRSQKPRARASPPAKTGGRISGRPPTPKVRSRRGGHLAEMPSARRSRYDARPRLKLDTP